MFSPYFKKEIGDILRKWLLSSGSVIHWLGSSLFQLFKAQRSCDLVFTWLFVTPLKVFFIWILMLKLAPGFRRVQQKNWWKKLWILFISEYKPHMKELPLMVFWGLRQNLPQRSLSFSVTQIPVYLPHSLHLRILPGEADCHQPLLKIVLVSSLFALKPFHELPKPSSALPKPSFNACLAFSVLCRHSHCTLFLYFLPPSFKMDSNICSFHCSELYFHSLLFCLITIFLCTLFSF